MGTHNVCFHGEITEYHFFGLKEKTIPNFIYSIIMRF